MEPLERAFAFAAKIQPTPRVDAAPTLAADAIRIAAPVEVETEFISSGEAAEEQTGGKGTYPASSKSGRIHIYRVRRRLRGTGVLYGAAALPEEHAFMKAILGNHVVDATLNQEKVTYNGLDEGEALLSLLAQTTRKQFKGTDAVPRSAKIVTDAGGHLMLELEFVSVGIVPTQQVLEAATLDNIVPPIAKGMTFTLNGVAVKPTHFEMDFGLAASDPLLDGSEADVHGGYVLTDRSARGIIRIRQPTLAVFDPYALMSAGTVFAFNGVFGTQQYNRIQIEADRMQIMKVSQPRQTGLHLYELEYVIHRAISPSVKDPSIAWT